MVAKVEAGFEYEKNYRREILSKLFDCIRSADSFHLIGAASMGKTRLLDFLMRYDVQELYLGEDAKKTWLVRVDLNRMPTAIGDKWGFYFFELLLSSISLCCNSRADVGANLLEEIVKRDAEVIKSGDLLYALRFFELGVSKLCQKHDIKICFLFDEFDVAYSKMPVEVFSQLRAVRDANKKSLVYGLFLRVPPKKLRPISENESFYELMSRNQIGIGPYTWDDIQQIVQHLEEEWSLELTPERREKICLASGGHAGFAKALLTLVKEPLVAKRMDAQDWTTWFGKQETIIEESQKIWEGLEADEQTTLLAVFQGGNVNSAIAYILVVKGILQKMDNSGRAFSPFFEQYLTSGAAKPTHAAR